MAFDTGNLSPKNISEITTNHLDDLDCINIFNNDFIEKQQTHCHQLFALVRLDI